MKKWWKKLAVAALIGLWAYSLTLTVKVPETPVGSKDWEQIGSFWPDRNQIGN